MKAYRKRRESLKNSKKSSKRGLNTLEGVYVPTLLTVLGVVMYLRLGWVIGNVGLIATLAIIVISHVITTSTALSMSSMVTNIKIGAGGAYSIITKSLGIEMGGAIGIPLYFSQAISVAFYITGFSEIWTSFFPGHSMRLVGLATWAVVAAVSIISARLAFRIQYFILGAVVLSIISVFTGNGINGGEIAISAAEGGIGFWSAFAIFFPAVTGVLTGATMSGELEDPKNSIIKGTLGAVLTGFVAYLALSLWFTRQVPQEILISNTSVILEIGSVRILVIAGVMGAVLSSALSTMVSSPRTLSALAGNRVIPKHRFFAKKSRSGEPFNAIVFSSLVSLAVLMFGNLNSLAELLTMFFLTTYTMINLVVLIEQGTGISSFRPTFSMSIVVPVIGAVGCTFAMLLINPVFTAVTFTTVIAIYSMLKRKNFVSPWGDVRGSVFVAISEWAAQKVMRTPYNPRLWKPAVAIPVESPEDFKRISNFVRNLLYKSGRLYYMTVYSDYKMDEAHKLEIDDAIEPLKEEGIFYQKILVKSDDFSTMLPQALQCLENSFLPPNSVLFTISGDQDKRNRMKKLIDSLRVTDISVMCLWIHPKYSFGDQRKVNIWLRDKSPNNDLAVLSALQMHRNLDAEISLCRVVESENKKTKEEKRLAEFIEEARLPGDTHIKVFTGVFSECFIEQKADLSIIGMPASYGEMIKMSDMAPGSLLFVSSGGMENLLV